MRFRVTVQSESGAYVARAAEVPGYEGRGTSQQEAVEQSVKDFSSGWRSVPATSPRRMESRSTCGKPDSRHGGRSSTFARAGTLRRIETRVNLSRWSIVTLVIAFTPVWNTHAIGRACDGGSWQPHAPMQIARQEVGAARIGGRVYVVGGLLAGKTIQATETVEAYDIAGDSWSFVAPTPIALHHMGAAALGGKLYVIGGYSAGFGPRAEVYVYDPASNVWSNGPSLPEPRGAGWAVAHEGKIYLFGGVGPSGVSRTTFIYDPADSSWTAGADMPTAREHLMAVSSGAHIYVIGGRNGPATNANERYTPVGNSWQTMAPMPTARSAAGAAAFAGRIIVAGGEVPELFAVNEVYDTSTNTWTCRAPMPVPRHGIAAVALDDRVLFPAGGIVQGLEPTNHVDSFIEPGVGVGGDTELELAIEHIECVPNPTHGSSEIRYRLRAQAQVGVAVFDLRGRRIVEVVPFALRSAGRHAAHWNGRDAQGIQVAPGIYWVRLRAGERESARRIAVVR